MKKFAIAIILTIMLFMMSGCKTNEEELSEKVTEWVSEDGVHYWMFCQGYRYALTPRYDHDGNLVIDAD